MSRHSRRAFTLVELLVVIGIIAILVGILLPTLGKARKAARTATCLTTVRQLGMAFTMYVNTYRRSIPYYTKTEEQGLWIGQLRGVYSRIDQSRFCPEAWEPLEPMNTNRVGDAFHCWGPSPGNVFIGNQRGSYGFNGWLFWYNADPANPSRGDAKGPALPGLPDYPSFDRDWWKAPVYKRASEVPVFGDELWTDSWPRPDDEVPTSLIQGYYNNSPTSGKNMMGRFCVARHGKAINICFSDGHAATVPLRELWSLPWSPRWKSPVPLPKIP